MRKRVRGGTRRLAQRGMVTVELALGIVTVTLLTAVLTTIIALGVQQAAIAESAAEIARQTARGDDDAVKAAKDRSPGTATVKPEREGVRVCVERDARVFGVGAVALSAEAYAAWEPGAGP